VTTGTRCPACGSMVRPDASWCSLCHADLRSEEEKAAARPPEPWLDESVEAPVWAPAPQQVEPVSDPVAAAVTAGTTATEAERRGRHARPAEAVPRAAAAVSTDEHVAPPETAAASAVASNADAALAKAGVDVEAMMSLLAADRSMPLPSLSGRLASKGNRAIAAVIAAVGLIAVGIVVMTLLGLLVH
jgi:hypothetical protein